MNREIQIFLMGYIVIEICEIFTVGGFPLADNVRLVSGCSGGIGKYTYCSQGFTAVHLAAIAATMWILFLNGIVGFQLLDDGTPLSLGAILVSAGAVFIGTGYITLDTAFSFTNQFKDSLTGDNRNIALYVLYQLFPLVCVVVFFVLETILVLNVLGERKPMRRCDFGHVA